MFTWDATHQIIADRRGRMMADADNARALRASVVSARPGRDASHLRIWRRSTGMVATLHR